MLTLAAMIALVEQRCPSNPLAGRYWGIRRQHKVRLLWWVEQTGHLAEGIKFACFKDTSGLLNWPSWHMSLAAPGQAGMTVHDMHQLQE